MSNSSRLFTDVLRGTWILFSTFSEPFTFPECCFLSAQKIKSVHISFSNCVTGLCKPTSSLFCDKTFIQADIGDVTEKNKLKVFCFSKGFSELSLRSRRVSPFLLRRASLCVCWEPKQFILVRLVSAAESKEQPRRCLQEVLLCNRRPRRALSMLLSNRLRILETGLGKGRAWISRQWKASL